MVQTVKEFADKGVESFRSIFTLGNKYQKEYGPEAFERALKNLFVRLEESPNLLSDVEALKCQNVYNDVLKTYTSIYTQANRFVDEEKARLRLQAKGYFQAIVARFLTTLAIGAGVLITYAVADCLEITMPLIRFTP